MWGSMRPGTQFEQLKSKVPRIRGRGPIILVIIEGEQDTADETRVIMRERERGVVGGMEVLRNDRLG